MKIVLIHNDSMGHPIDSTLISGGTERFGQLIWKNIPNVFPVYVPNTSAKKTSSEEKKSIIKNVIGEIRKINPDIIISNVMKTTTLTGLTDLSIPIMFVQHVFMGVISSNYRLLSLINRGHSYFTVSNLTKKFYDDKSDRFGIERPICSGILKPDYVESLTIGSHDIYDCVTIGRPSSDKNPFLLNKLLNNTKYQHLTITYKPKEDSEMYNYYSKNAQWTNVSLGEPHSNAMKLLSGASTYFSTWSQETFGITALEALSMGIPVILKTNTKGEHASYEIIPTTEYFYPLQKPNTDNLSQAIDSFANVDRQAIREVTYEYNSKKTWVAGIQNAIDKTIETYKNKNTNIEYFV